MALSELRTVHTAEHLVHEGHGIPILVDDAARGAVRHKALSMHTINRQTERGSVSGGGNNSKVK